MTPTRQAIRLAVGTVDDPEYPGVSIIELGLLDQVDVDEDGGVVVKLTPTFLGCPALDIIRSDVQAAVDRVPGVRSCAVEFQAHPPWTAERISPEGRAKLARDFSVVVRVGTALPDCPVCAEPSLSIVSEFGSSLCREVSRCDTCTNPIEVVRT